MPESNQASLFTCTGQSLQRTQQQPPGPAALLSAAHRMKMAILAAWPAAYTRVCFQGGMVTKTVSWSWLCRGNTSYDPGSHRGTREVRNPWSYQRAGQSVEGSLGKQFWMTRETHTDNTQSLFSSSTPASFDSPFGWTRTRNGTSISA